MSFDPNHGHSWRNCHDAGPAHDPRAERACVCYRCDQAFVIKRDNPEPLPPCLGQPECAHAVDDKLRSTMAYYRPGARRSGK